MKTARSPATPTPWPSISGRPRRLVGKAGDKSRGFRIYAGKAELGAAWRKASKA